MVLIYLPSITNRAEYIFRLFFQDLIGLDFSLTESIRDFTNFTGPKINYSENIIGQEIFIKAAPLLFEKNIDACQIRMSEYKSVPVFFSTDDLTASLPFDPFAAGFYMVSRFEEFNPFKGDRYGRFRLHDSIAHTGNFIRKPVVNLWSNMVRDLMTTHYPGLHFSERNFRFIPTIDIDHAYAFGHRKFVRILGGFSRDIKNGDFRNFILRSKVMFRKEKDPYDNYDLIRQMHVQYNVQAIFFVLFADYGNNDNNVSVHNKEFRALIQRLDTHSDVGIHPSLASNRKTHLLKSEISRLSHLLHRNITLSRQHFLKISLPKTYRNLIKLGIRHDYSMGYAGDPGFRAGIADPFRFFDLVENKETDLTIHPVTVMDVTLRDYHGMNREKSLETIFSMIDEVRSVNGEFISLWHNESFSEMEKWKGWRTIYEEMIKYATG